MKYYMKKVGLILNSLISKGKLEKGKGELIYNSLKFLENMRLLYDIFNKRVVFF